MIYAHVRPRVLCERNARARAALVSIVDFVCNMRRCAVWRMLQHRQYNNNPLRPAQPSVLRLRRNHPAGPDQQQQQQSIHHNPRNHGTHAGLCPDSLYLSLHLFWCAESLCDVADTTRRYGHVRLLIRLWYNARAGLCCAWVCWSVFVCKELIYYTTYVCMHSWLYDVCLFFAHARMTETHPRARDTHAIAHTQRQHEHNRASEGIGQLATS